MDFLTPITQTRAAVRDLLSLALSESHGVSWATSHASLATGTSTTAEEEKTGKKSRGENKTLGKLSQATGFLLWQDSDIDLKQK